ncbi:hypothetical protein L804_04421 [Cryptococcus deuterogattii 2001/935-1]|nr:hypothetical protein L804_04421 [Cryptococcus deuterogattii 2001/935-1]
MSQLLWISDASPLFSYSLADTTYSSGQGLNSWIGWGGSNPTTAVVAANGGGGTTSYHSTKGVAEVKLPAVYATSFVPIFSAPESYNVTMQQNSNGPQNWKSGQNWTSLAGDFGAKTFSLQVSCYGDCDEFIFEGAWVKTELAPEGSDTESLLLDDSSSLVHYTSFTSVETNSELVQVSSSDYNSSLSMTSIVGASASVMFKVIDEFTVNGPKGGIEFVGTIGGHTTTVGPSSAGLISNNDSSASNSTEITTLSAATEGGAPNIGVIIGAILGSLAGVVCLIIKDELAGKETMTKTMNRQSCISSFEELFLRPRLARKRRWIRGMRPIYYRI